MAALGLLLLASLIGLGLWNLWRPEHVVWAKNAYGMAQAGAWEGWEGFVASMAFWFFDLKGRTAATLLGIAVWVACAWFLAYRLLIKPGHSR